MTVTMALTYVPRYTFLMVFDIEVIVVFYFGGILRLKSLAHAPDQCVDHVTSRSSGGSCSNKVTELKRLNDINVTL